jgi:hypothetical protein
MEEKLTEEMTSEKAAFAFDRFEMMGRCRVEVRMLLLQELLAALPLSELRDQHTAKLKNQWPATAHWQTPRGFKV